MVGRDSNPRLPKGVERILADADDPPPPLDQLYSSGIFLAKKTQKFMLHKKLNCNCFMLYARALSIEWGSDQRYWKWKNFQEKSGTWIEVAELIDVCWLELLGTLDARKLSAGVMYGVSFHVMLKSTGYYGRSPVKVDFELAGLKKQESEMYFIDMLKDTWMEIPVAQFVAPGHDKAGEMKIHLTDISSHWKRGLVVKGVSVKPL